MSQSPTAYIRERTRLWAEQTGESYRCPQHSDPNPFCHCADATGRIVAGRILYDGKWTERGNEIQSARRRYHIWAEQQRPEVQTSKEKFKQMIQAKQEEVQGFKEWRSQWAAAGFVTVGYYANGRK